MLTMKILQVLFQKVVRSIGRQRLTLTHLGDEVMKVLGV